MNGVIVNGQVLSIETLERMAEKQKRDQQNMATLAMSLILTASEPLFGPITADAPVYPAPKYHNGRTVYETEKGLVVELHNPGGLNRYSVETHDGRYYLTPPRGLDGTPRQQPLPRSGRVPHQARRHLGPPQRPEPDPQA